VVTDHDFGEIEACRSMPARRKLFGDVVRESSGMIAVSRRMEMEMRDQFPFARTFTIPNGAEPLGIEMRKRARPAELRHKRVVFSCGTFYERKGFPLLIDAFARIAGKYPDAELRIAGDGVERPEVERRILHHQLRSRVRLLGARPNREVLQEMAWSDVFALIGWDEPFATVYLEALSAAVPLICCSDGGITDVVRDGEHAAIIPPRDVAAAADALDRLLGNDRKREEMGRNALGLFETSLTWDHHAQRMMDVFESVVPERAPAIA
jgi:glycosyltransferase involved in cell wall biosynthesis